MTIIIIISIIVILSLIYFLNSKLTNLSSIVNISSMVSPETKLNDMSLVNESIDIAFKIVFYDYLNKDFQCLDKKTLEPLETKILKHNYRKLVLALYAGNNYIAVRKDKSVISLTEMFINAVYIHYMSETSSYIKKMLFKYYSGYSADNYFLKKKGKPSCLTYLTTYIIGKIGNLYIDLIEDETRISTHVSNNSPAEKFTNTYTTEMSNRNDKMFQKSCLDIYNIYAVGSITKDLQENNIKPDKEGKVE